MKKLGFGLMRLPLTDRSDEKSIDVHETEEMVDRFLENGFTYFDTAWMYHGFRSEEVAGETLVKRHPRDSFQLASKLHSGFFDSEEDMDRVLREQLEKTHAEYFDNYLLHGIDGESLEKYEKLGAFDWILRQKEKGLINHAGFSFHDSAGVLEEILSKHPEMEFVQLQINYLDWNSPWIQSREVHDTAVRHGKPIIVMEPVKGGTLANLPDEAMKLFREHDPEASAASWAIRFAASLDNVQLVLSGMSSLKQLESNMETMKDFKPLTEQEKKLCLRVADVINSQITVPCTACHYCTEGCPKNIAIPDYFSLYNEDMREDLEKKGWTVNFSTYQAIAKKHGKASDCIECGRCEKVCPQHIPVISELKAVAGHFEHNA